MDYSELDLDTPETVELDVLFGSDLLLNRMQRVEQIFRSNRGFDPLERNNQCMPVHK